MPQTNPHDGRKMFHEDRRVTDPAILCKILDGALNCTVALHDEPYPYIVPMNFGYTYSAEEGFVFYLHMANWGYKLDCIERDPHAAINVYSYLDRFGHPYRKESHDYRSVNAFGLMEEIVDEEEMTRALSIISVRTGRPALIKIPPQEKIKMRIFRMKADIVTGKTQYPISSVDEVPMPPVGE